MAPRQEPDWKGPDGYLTAGWRLVRKGGEVRFHGSLWRHASLSAHVGQKVFVHIRDTYGSKANCTFDASNPGGWLPLTLVEYCGACGKEIRPREAACAACAHHKPRLDTSPRKAAVNE